PQRTVGRAAQAARRAGALEHRRGARAADLPRRPARGRAPRRDRRLRRGAGPVPPDGAAGVRQRGRHAARAGGGCAHAQGPGRCRGARARPPRAHAQAMGAGRDELPRAARCAAPVRARARHARERAGLALRGYRGALPGAGRRMVEPGEGAMKKRMVIMLVCVGLLLGLLVGFNWFKGYMMAKYMASAPIPAATVTAMAAGYQEWQPQISAVGTLRAVRGVDVTT